MRAELEAASKKRGWTLTEELLWRLRVFSARQQEDRREPTVRAVCYLISKIAESAYAHVPGQQLWHRDPFMFKTFKLGVAKLLDALEPRGELESPFAGLEPGNLLFETYKTPESAADFAAAAVLRPLFHPNPLTQDQKEEIILGGNMSVTGPGIGEQIIEALARDFYTMSNVRRDLGIEESKRLRPRPRE